MLAHRNNRFQRHVSRSLDCPFVVLFDQDGADQAGDGILVGKDADDVGSPLDPAMKAFERVGRMQLGSARRGGTHIGEDIMLGLVHDGRRRGSGRTPPIA